MSDSVLQFPTAPAFQELLEAERKNFHKQFMRYMSRIAYFPAIRAKAEVICVFRKRLGAQKLERDAADHRRQV